MVGKTPARATARKNNSRALITATVSKHGPISRTQLAALTGLSPRYVTEVVDGLMAEKVLIEAGSVSKGRGRPRILLSINPDNDVFGGVWLSEDAIEIAVASPDSEILTRDSIEYGRCNKDTSKLVSLIADSIRDCVARAGRDPATLQGVGVTVAGRIDMMLGMIVIAVNEHWITNVPITKLLGQALGVPVYMDADIRASALAHQWRSKSATKALYLSFSDGMGSTLVEEHRLFDGIYGTAPVLGHIIVEPGGPKCSSAFCGKRGCLEAFTSTFAFIRKLWPEVDPSAMTSQARHEMVRSGLAMASQGDKTALAVAAQVANYMALGICNAIATLGPEVVYVGGCMIDGAPDLMLKMIRKYEGQYGDPAFAAEIRALPRIDEFEVRGSLAAVMLRPYVRLQEANERLLSLQARPEPEHDALPASYTRGE